MIMLYPSIDELLEKLDSKYTLVTLASKRARELRDYPTTYIDRAVSFKNVGVALEEIMADKIEYEKPRFTKERYNDSES